MLKSGKEGTCLRAKEGSESKLNIINNSDPIKINACISLKPECTALTRFQFENIKSFKKPRPKLKSLRTNGGTDIIHSKSLALPELTKPLNLQP